MTCKKSKLAGLLLGILTLTTCGTEPINSGSWSGNFSSLHEAHTAGVCTQADRRDHIYRGNRAFAEKWEQCGRSSMGNGDEASKCLKNGFSSLSASCAGCFGKHVSCTKANCFWKCAFGSEASCEACANEFCLPDLTDCTGVSARNLPSKYP